MINHHPAKIRSLVTIGAYGFDAGSFFQALRDHAVDTFVDVRQRRGVRGAQYAFANSQRLQARLAELGIHYVYAQTLAPTTAVRDQQRRADADAGTAKRDRSVLSPAFVAAYETEILAAFSPEAFLTKLPADAQVVALFCVERAPDACHRSLAAARLSTALNMPVTHIVPPDPPAAP